MAYIVGYNEAMLSFVRHFGGMEQSAKAIGRSVPSIRRWLTGESKPSLEICFQIESLTGGQVKATDIIGSFVNKNKVHERNKKWGSKNERKCKDDLG